MDPPFIEVLDCFCTYANYNIYTAIVGGHIMCMHEGISKKFQSLEQLKNVKRPMLVYPKNSLEADILWSYPNGSIYGYRNSPRGCGCEFGKDKLLEMLEKFNMEHVVRAHQDVQDEYEFSAGRKLVTVFSASHYCGEFNKAAAVMTVSERLECLTFGDESCQQKYNPEEMNRLTKLTYLS